MNQKGFSSHTTIVSSRDWPSRGCFLSTLPHPRRCHPRAGNAPIMGDDGKAT